LQKAVVFVPENLLVFKFFLFGVDGTGARFYFFPAEKIFEENPNSGKVLYIYSYLFKNSNNAEKLTNLFKELVKRLNNSFFQCIPLVEFDSKLASMGTKVVLFHF